MATLDRLVADDLRSVTCAYRDALRAHQDAINRLNVYPVPDGDTGTNMALTLESVVAEIESVVVDVDDAPNAADMVATCKAISHGSLMGARGNSGVILSQILRGLCDVFREVDAVDGQVLARAMRAASDAAYAAVMKPVEGTILTVVREASDAAIARADSGYALVEVLEAAEAAAADALRRTPEMLPVLAEAGVVDAGGTGFALFINAVLSVVDGRPVPDPPPSEGATIDAAFSERMQLAHVNGDHDVSSLRYEVMYFLEAPDDTIGAFKDVWAGIGDSIVVVGGDGIWNCHIHTDDIGASIEAAIEIGKPRRIRVTDLVEQMEEERWVREAEAVPFQPERLHQLVETAVVAVAAGDGIRRIFYSLGVKGIVHGGQTMNPSTAQLLEAVNEAPAEEVIILPNNKNIIPVAEQVDAQTSKTVYVVPTIGIAEGFASLLAYDPQASGVENAKAMAAAATNVAAGEVTQAVRDSTCELGPISEGDFIGLSRDGILAISGSLDEACIRLLDRLVGDDHELVTVIEGEGSSGAVTRHLHVWLAEHRPGVDTEIHSGGQPLYPYLFGVE